MLVTFLQGEAISNHVLNQSHSKQMYSFPKSPRFKVLNKSASGYTGTSDGHREGKEYEGSRRKGEFR